MASEKEDLIILENLFNSGKYDEVIKSSGEFLEDFPDSFQIGYIRFKALSKSGRVKESEESVDSLLKKYPENINLLVEKGYIQFRNGKEKEAKSYFEKALFLDPFNIKAKNGIKEIKKAESEREKSEGETMSFVAPREEKKTGLEDTISESDLEKLMELKNVEAERIVSKELSEPEISISFEDSTMRKRDDIFQAVEEQLPPQKETEGKSNIETALNELNKLSESDLRDLKLEDDQREDVAGAGETDGEKSSFITESAALIYLKQGLIGDAEKIYADLYKDSDPDKYREKRELVQRIKLLQAKLAALKSFMNKMIRAGENIV